METFHIDREDHPDVLRLLGRTSKTTQVRKPTTLKSRLSLEALEGREVPAVFTVNSLMDLHLGQGQPPTGGGSPEPVQITIDGPPGDPPPPVYTLRAAIAAATNQGTAPGERNEVRFAASLFTNGPAIIALLPELGQIDIRMPVVITGPGADQLTVSAMATEEDPFRIFSVIGRDMPVDIIGMKMMNGKTGVNDPRGGAILNTGKLLLKNCVFADNEAASEGGALANLEFGQVTIRACTFDTNSAGTDGGAIWSDKNTLIKTEKIGNKKTTFIHNEATLGGAVALEGNSVSGVFWDTQFLENYASGDGGGLYASAGGGNSALVLKDCAVTGNTAQRRGGGVITHFWNADYIDTTFTGNQADEAGAVAVEKHTSNFTGCAFNGNLANIAPLIGFWGNGVNDPVNTWINLANCVGIAQADIVKCGN